MNHDPTRSPWPDTDRNLLVGLLALQNSFISRDALVAAFCTWIADKSKSLDRILLDQGHLDNDCHALLMGLARQHLKLHGDDPEKSLADLSAVDSALRRLADLGDPGVSASLARVSSARQDGHHLDPNSTATFLGAPTSRGGRFRVLRLHAEGGLGEVFVARDEEVHREVALKQIKPERSADAQGRARFLLEAEITGGLEHPGVVPVYGLGTYEDGRPFYAMRFIRGDSLKEAIGNFHADAATQRDPGRRALALNKLLRRFLDVCNAIGYAHSRGVLHRDLKPGNILLGDYGETLVLDWGLAKAVGHHLEPAVATRAEDTLRPELGSDLQPTAIGSLQGTPAYMPPEQAAGRLDELGPRSDVYSLGATLYALLTGRAPFEEPHLATLLRHVQRGEFPRPRKIRLWIDPALEAVCLKAMALRSEDRYPTPRALAEDIEHWLADEPVTARRDALWTRSWRWVRKHRTLSATAAAVLALLAAGLGIGLQRERLHAARIAAERSEAERRLDQAMASYEEYFSGFNEEVLRGRKLPPDLLESLLAKPRAFYERLTAELAAKPAPTEKERALLARGRYNLGVILTTLGRHAESEGELEAARRMYEALLRERRGIPDYPHRLARSYDGLGRVFRETGRPREAEEAQGKAIAALEPLVKDYPGVPHYQSELADCYYDLGGVLESTGQRGDAEEAYGKAVAALERLVQDNPGVSDYQNSLARILARRGVVVAEIGRPGEAEKAYGKAIAMLEPLVKNHPGVSDYQSNLAHCYLMLGDVLTATGHPKEAEEALGKQIAMHERLVKDQPGVPTYQELLAAGYNHLGWLFQEMGRHGEAVETYGTAIAAYERLVKDHSGIPNYREGLAGSFVNLGFALSTLGRPGEAEEAYGKAVAILEPLVRDHPGVPSYRTYLGNCYNNLGIALEQTNRLRQAEQVYGKAIAIFERPVAEHPEQADDRSRLGAALNNLGRSLAAQGDFESAIARHREAIGHQRAAFNRLPQVIQYRQSLSYHYQLLGRALRALGRADEAAGATREGMKLWPRNPGELYNVACEFALCIPIAKDEVGRARHAAEAMAALHDAVTAGWSDAAHTARDADLNPLHDRSDFRRLLSELFDRVFPADPFAR
jgi:serine/threonine-protein kinase